MIAKTRNGELYSWGRNNHGQLGIGNGEDQNTPVCINNIENIDLYEQKIIKLKEYNSCIYVETEQKKWYKEYIPPAKW